MMSFIHLKRFQFLQLNTIFGIVGIYDVWKAIPKHNFDDKELLLGNMSIF